MHPLAGALLALGAWVLLGRSVEDVDETVTRSTKDRKGKARDATATTDADDETSLGITESDAASDHVIALGCARTVYSLLLTGDLDTENSLKRFKKCLRVNGASQAFRRSQDEDSLSAYLLAAM